MPHLHLGATLAGIFGRLCLVNIGRLCLVYIARLSLVKYRPVNDRAGRGRSKMFANIDNIGYPGYFGSWG